MSELNGEYVMEEESLKGLDVAGFKEEALEFWVEIAL